MMGEYVLDIFEGVEATVNTCYQAAERQTLEDPGCEEEHYIESVILNDVDITDCLTEEYQEVIMKKIARANEPDYESMAESRHREGGQ